MRGYRIILPFALLLVSVLACRRAEQPHPPPQPTTRQPEPLRIGVIPALSGLPTFIAIETRLFHEAGFAPVVREYRTSDLVVSALAAGEIDMVGVGGMTQILQLAERQPDSLLLLAVLYSSTCIVTPSTKGVTHLRDLRSKTVATFPGSVFARYAREALSSSDVDISKTVFAPMAPGLQIQALRNGEIAAAYTLEPTCAEAVFNGDARYLVTEDLFAKHFLDGRPFPGGGVVVARTYLSRNATRLGRLQQVYSRALKIASTADDMAKYLRKYTPLSRDFIAQAKYEGASLARQEYGSQVQQLIHHLRRWGFLRNELDVARLSAPR